MTTVLNTVCREWANARPSAFKVVFSAISRLPEVQPKREDASTRCSTLNPIPAKKRKATAPPCQVRLIQSPSHPEGWVGELCNYTVPYQYTVKEFKMLVGQVEKLNMVLAVHTELEEMENILQKFPEAIIVFPHFGDSHEYNHIFKRIDLVAKNANCYVDTSGSGHDRVGMLEYAIKTVGPERVLFGSDSCINCPATVIARVENAFVTEDQKRKILSENLQALLKRVQG
jgi:hypothetical protein